MTSGQLPYFFWPELAHQKYLYHPLGCDPKKGPKYERKMVTFPPVDSLSRFLTANLKNLSSLKITIAATEHSQNLMVTKICVHEPKILWLWHHVTSYFWDKRAKNSWDSSWHQKLNSVFSWSSQICGVWHSINLSYFLWGNCTSSLQESTLLY